MKDVHAAKFGNDGTRNEEGRAVCGSTERIAVVALWIPSAGRLYLAGRKEYFLENRTRQLGAALS